MLEIKNITKVYMTAGLEQKALDNVSIQFRENEFVSILGPSGSGKTTLLNIIGGLDNYTEGDLTINGVSTKKYRDRDWDTYRNHSVGFVFQSYNLIPHQSALSNVELALTLSGVSKEERRKRSIEVLKKVGLESQMHKRPNQMSGGQMQRVAIARALVNEPDILLADEPTGALDSETSIQIMELLKEIAKEKLVVMVTHNPDLADSYSTRIVKLLDGKITNDSNPVKENIKVDKAKKEKTKKRSSKKTSMSFMTALSLSLNNLMTKKGRTILTAFAGSIGIIGIALILSLSSGVQNYISRVEEDTLSSYPLTVEEQSIDTASMITTLMGKQNNEEHELDKVYSSNIMTDLINSMSAQLDTNNLEEFKKFLDNNDNMHEYTTDIQYTYRLPIELYKSNTSNEVLQVNPSTVFDAFNIDGMSGMMEMQNAMGNGTSTMNVFQELLNNQELLSSQYDILAGRFPDKYNEVVMIVNEDNEISDYALYALGLKDQAELANLMDKIKNGEEIQTENTSYTYDEILNLTFKLVLPTDYYQKSDGIWLDKSGDTTYMKELVDSSPEIKVVGILRPNEEAAVTSVSGTIGYTHALTEHVIEEVNKTEIAQEQLASPDVNIFTGLPFSDSNDKFSIDQLTDEQKAYLATLSPEELSLLLTQYSENANASYEDNLLTLGVVDIDKPSSIRIYPKDFDSKEEIIQIIEDYNQDKESSGNEADVIRYTDIVGVMMSSVSTIIEYFNCFCCD